MAKRLKLNQVTSDLSGYTLRFTQLSIDSYHGQESPYKPALLLAVISAIESGAIMENQITFSPELVASFRTTYTELNSTERYRDPKIALPFYHLQKDGFWHLHTYPGLEILVSSSHSLLSFKNLRESVEYASLDEPLWALLIQPESREVLRQAILLRYFPQTRHQYRPTAGDEEVARIRRQILEEPAALYAQYARATALDELDTAVRSGVFKREVLSAYNHTCAVSGLRLTSTAAASSPLLDSCHIVPWAISYDDTLPNGLALCPNLHRAFDRHLFSIDPEYRVRCAPNFSESGNAAYGIKQFEGKQLELPKDKTKWPEIGNLNKQRQG